MTDLRQDSIAGAGVIKYEGLRAGKDKVLAYRQDWHHYRQRQWYIRQLLLLAILLLLIILVKLFLGRTERKEEEEEPSGTVQELVIIGTSGSVEGLDDGQVLTDQGLYEAEGDMIETVENLLMHKAEVTVRDGVICGAEAAKDDSAVLENIYILEAQEEQLLILYDNYHVTLTGVFAMEYDYDHVADICLDHGTVAEVHIKSEEIAGDILAVHEDSIEIEGYGVLPLASGFRIYENYETPVELTAAQLMVGYDIAQFVVADGEICAGIITAPADMQTVRVLLMDSGFDGMYHESIRLVCTTDARLVTSQGETVISAGEAVDITPDDMEMNGRIRLIPVQEDGEIGVETITRAQGVPYYRGFMEINRREEGLLLINEIGLEAYLCSVVPSEMPASYEEEALKAQAVCARSYAYQQIRLGSYREYGAHVVDSVSSQVYNNTQRYDSSSRAVYETAGMVAVKDGEVITAYYFSTSCGQTAGGGVWGGEEIAYLQPKAVQDEEGNDYEEEEPWYRWSVQARGSDYLDGVAERAQDQVRLGKGYVRNKEGVYVSQEAYGKEVSIGEVTDIREGERLEGGVLHELYVDGSEGSIQIVTENAIRTVLCTPGLEATRQDGSVATLGSLLPSGFFTLQTVWEEGKLSGVDMSGGGYGHGVGMSQNGANRMAEAGKNYEEILKFFYSGIELEQLNSAEKDEADQ